MVNGGGLVGGFRMAWLHHILENYTLGPIHYYKHEKRQGRGPNTTPQMILPPNPNFRHYMCNSIEYGAQTQQYRRAT